MLDAMLANLRRSAPLVHCITNYVTANDCANLLLACGASPILADDPAEAAEIAAQCGALTLNLGTLSRQKLPAFFAAGQAAAARGRPVVLDPVGAGASALRTSTARQLLGAVRCTAVRANASELRALAGQEAPAHGVDAAPADAVTGETLPARLALAAAFARQHRTIAAMTGALDLVTDGHRTYCIRNGHPLLCRVTGTGCMLTALVAAFLAANPDRPLEAAAAAVVCMGLAGEQAAQRMHGPDGTGSFRVYLIDAVSTLTPEQLAKGARYELYKNDDAALCRD